MENHRSNLDLRYERKYGLSLEDFPRLKAALLSSGYYKLYPDRVINNVYYDTQNLSNYEGNLEGFSRRFKVRVRWYDDLDNNCTLEIKEKIDNLNRKKSFKFLRGEDNLIRQCPTQLPKEVHEELYSMGINISKFIPILRNSYKREYYFNDKLGVRLTVDSCLNYQNLRTMRKASDNISLVVEIKYPGDINFNETLDVLGLHLSKNSKYINGVDLTM